jgi:hypothetical protein
MRISDIVVRHRKPDWHRNAHSRITLPGAPSSMTEATFLLPALFTRSCCFHHALTTTSSATRATKSL